MRRWRESIEARESSSRECYGNSSPCLFSADSRTWSQTWANLCQSHNVWSTGTFVYRSTSVPPLQSLFKFHVGAITWNVRSSQKAHPISSWKGSSVALWHSGQGVELSREEITDRSFVFTCGWKAMVVAKHTDVTENLRRRSTVSTVAVVSTESARVAVRELRPCTSSLVHFLETALVTLEQLKCCTSPSANKEELLYLKHVWTVETEQLQVLLKEYMGRGLRSEVRRGLP